MIAFYLRIGIYISYFSFLIYNNFLRTHFVRADCQKSSGLCLVFVLHYSRISPISNLEGDLIPISLQGKTTPVTGATNGISLVNPQELACMEAR